jgi:type III pantothenate kinase
VKLLLALDVGNTQITVGIYEGEVLRHTGRLHSDRKHTSEEWGVQLTQALGLWGISKERLGGIIVASVVPPIDAPLRDACRDYLKRTPLFVTSSIRLGIKNRYKNPDEVGADRLVNAVAIHRQLKKAAIVVDFGTATTFDCVGANGDYMGGVIAPGLEMAQEALASKTAKLPRIVFEVPRFALGKTTKESLQSGLFWGYIGLVEGILLRLVKEMKSSGTPVPMIVATGGLSTVIGPRLTPPAKVMPHLTLDGLRILWMLNKGAV